MENAAKVARQEEPDYRDKTARLEGREKGDRKGRRVLGERKELWDPEATMATPEPPALPDPRDRPVIRDRTVKMEDKEREGEFGNLCTGTHRDGGIVMNRWSQRRNMGIPISL